MGWENVIRLKKNTEFNIGGRRRKNHRKRQSGGGGCPWETGVRLDLLPERKKMGGRADKPGTEKTFFILRVHRAQKGYDEEG